MENKLSEIAQFKEIRRNTMKMIIVSVIVSENLAYNTDHEEIIEWVENTLQEFKNEIENEKE